VLVGESKVITVRFADRLNHVSVTFPVVGLPIANAGTYDFRVFANGALLEQQSFTANLGPPGAAAGDEH